MPANDPRFVSLTEMDILEDLLVGMYFEHEARKRLDPDSAAEEAQQDTELMEGYADMERDYASGEMQDKIQAFLRTRQKGPPKKVVSIKTGVILG